MGSWQKAESLFERLLAVRERVLGKDHPHTAWTAMMVGGLRSRSGDYAAAEVLLLRAHETQKRILRPDHPDLLPVPCPLPPSVTT